MKRTTWYGLPKDGSIYILIRAFYTSILQMKPSIFTGTFKNHVIDKIRVRGMPYKGCGDGAKVRNYADYQSYLEHQSSKFKTMETRLEVSFDRRANDFFNGFRKHEFLEGLTVICLGSRDGAEVHALRKMGLLAVGVDIKYPEGSEFTHFGDFHDIPYPDGVFGAAYTNCLDHIHSPQKFLSEIRRVLTGDGLLIVDMTLGDGVYESFSIESYKAGISLVENNGFLFDAKSSGFVAETIENTDFENEANGRPRSIFRKKETNDE